MKALFYISFLLLGRIAYGQQSPIDSLSALLAREKQDTVRVQLLNQLTRLAAGQDLQKAKQYATAALKEATTAK